MYSHYHGGLHLFNTAWEQRHRINETFVPSSPRVNPLIRANFIPYSPLLTLLELFDENFRKQTTNLFRNPTYFYETYVIEITSQENRWN